MPARRWAGIGAAPSTMTSRPSGYPLRETARPARRGRRTGSSRTAHFKDGIGERLRGLLREVVADAALDGAVRVAARELPGIGARVRVRRPVGVALEGDRRHRDPGCFGEALLQLAVLRFAFREPQPPAVVVDHDLDVIRVVERRRAPIESRVVEAPLRRGRSPDDLREVAPVLVIAGPALFGREVAIRGWPARTDTGDCLGAVAQSARRS